MRTYRSTVLWLLLLLAFFHASTFAGHTVHGLGEPWTAAVAAQADTASDSAPAPQDSSPHAGHAHCAACMLHAHGALAAFSAPAWQPVFQPAAPWEWAHFDDTPLPATTRRIFAARDPPSPG